MSNDVREVEQWVSNMELINTLVEMNKDFMLDDFSGVSTFPVGYHKEIEVHYGIESLAKNLGIELAERPFHVNFGEENRFDEIYFEHNGFLWFQRKVRK